MLLCTISTQPHATIYQILNGNNLIATVAKWQPSAEDEIVSFKVPVYDLGPIDQIDDESGELVGEYNPCAPKNARAFDAEQTEAYELAHPGACM
jgi:hypothetical protein